MRDDFAGNLEDSFEEVRGFAAGLSEELAAATREMRAMDTEARRLSRSLGSSLRSAFDRAIFGGKGLGEVIRGLARDVLSSSVNAAVKPISSGLGAALTGAFSSLGGAAAGVFGFEKGGAFSAGRVRAFARGGVVDGPVGFPMRGGLGVMGEAGPEAVMPLERGPDGRLRVRAVSGAPQGSTVVVNISTPDVEGFRRSRGQVAAQLARAVARGRQQL